MRINGFTLFVLVAYVRTLILYLFETEGVGKSEISCFSFIMRECMGECDVERPAFIEVVISNVVRDPLPILFNSINRF